MHSNYFYRSTLFRFSIILTLAIHGVTSLIDTFFVKQRFTGARYKVSNWQHVGDIQGLRKVDTLHRNAQSTKRIWICAIYLMRFA